MRTWIPNAHRWEISPPYEGAEELAGQLRTTPLVAQILHNRGIDSPDSARAFLNPKLTDLHDPSELPGCEQAAERIAGAVRDEQRIVIYGDYDVDGMTGTAILHACLRMLGAAPDFYVPHRLEEGYGVNVEAIRRIVADGAGLIVTVDCGIRAGEALSCAKTGGVDVIVTDHHTPDPDLPDVAAVVHPAIPHDRDTGKKYPNPNLCGAGVAFKLAWQTARVMCGNTRVDDQMKEFLLDATCLAALGTIADIVPLVGENRVLATYGLRGLPSSKHTGLRALLKSADLGSGRLDAYHVGFVLAPRLNAAGRMGDARLAVELLTTDSTTRAEEIARHLAKQNTERQKVERQITEQATQMVLDAGLDDREHRAIVLGSKDWHGGVIGIVASRLVDRFHRPAVLIALDDDGRGQGSGRSIPGFHMAEALTACDEHLISHGGHAMAGGLKIRTEHVGAFSEAFSRYAGRSISDEQLTPPLHIDAEATLPELGYHVVGQLERMAPFGCGNPRPVVAIRQCRMLSQPKRMGRNGQALSLLLTQNDVSIRTVGFGMGDLAENLPAGSTLDVVAQPRLNTFNGRTTAELQLRDVIWEQ